MYFVTDFLENAERILQTAASAGDRERESGNLDIVIGRDGAIRIVMNSDWMLDSLQAHHGASAAYRVTSRGAEVSVEGKSRTGLSCLLTSEPFASIAKRMLSNQPRYFLSGKIEPRA